MTTINHIIAKKNIAKIIALTAYDYTMAKLIDEAGVDIILVGDSVGMVVCGDKDTKQVTLAQVTYHTRAVARGVKNALVVADLPVDTYRTVEAARASSRVMLDAGAHAVKVEYFDGVIPVVEALVRENIAVMGHVGLTPQTAERYKVTGKDDVEAARIMREAHGLESAGVFSLVIECVPSILAGDITRTVKVPTIGIGAGPLCDGQVLVCYDALGMFRDFRPKFVRTFANTGEVIKNAVGLFRAEVNAGTFPAKSESF
jgi:3-methyl-2-oxobutanoate hydroxymethyltransferase